MTDNTLQNLTFTADQENYLNWLATPATCRTPKTKTEYAELIGKTRQALWLWEQQPGFDEERKQRIKRWQKESTPLIIESLKEKALSGDVQAIRTWLDWVEGTESKLKIEHTGKITLDAVKEWINAKEPETAAAH